MHPHRRTEVLRDSRAPLATGVSIGKMVPPGDAQTTQHSCSSTPIVSLSPRRSQTLENQSALNMLTDFMSGVLIAEQPQSTLRAICCSTWYEDSPEDNVATNKWSKLGWIRNARPHDIYTASQRIWPL